LKHPVVTAINILGLTTGLTVTFLLMYSAMYELSYDKFHLKADRIHRIAMLFYQDGQLAGKDAMTYAPVGAALMDEYPDVSNFTRVSPEYDRVILINEENNKFAEESRVYYADSTFFEIFDFPLLYGNPSTALSKVGQIVLTKSSAEMYFGPVEEWRESPVGKLLSFNGTLTLSVSGIMDELPHNSHIQFNAIISFVTFSQTNGDPTDNWGWNDFYTYVVLGEETDHLEFESRLPDFLAKYKESYDANEKMIVQPLTDIHLKSNLGFEAQPNGDINTVKILVAIALAILLLAWVNYINLSTAMAENRSREVGIKKVVGAPKASLVFQFLTESFLLNFISYLLAVCITLLLLDPLGVWMGKPLSEAMSLGEFFTIAALLYLAGSLLSGIYPSIAKVILKSDSGVIQKDSLLRKGLVVFQFVMSMALISGTLIINSQIDFMGSYNLGFNKDHMLIIKAPSTVEGDQFRSRYEGFKNRLKQQTGIVDVTMSSAIPGKSLLDLDTHGGLRLVSQLDEDVATYTHFGVDDNFVETYQIDLIAGRNFDENRLADDSALLVSKTALPLLGIDNPDDVLGQKFQYWGRQLEIIGVVDYHHRGLKSNLDPIIITNRTGFILYFSIKVTDQSFDQINRIIEVTESTWEETYPDNPFSYFFLDDHFNEQYQSEIIFGKTWKLFSLLAIVIACLGLGGLTSYSISKREKEIGIRKTLGAEIKDIMIMFSYGYLKLVLIAIALSVPLTWLLMDSWLDGFAYRINPGFEVYVISGSLITLIAMTIVNLLSWRSARINPVHTLRNE